MSQPKHDLSVRRHDRHACDAPAVLSIPPEHVRAVRLGRSVGDGHGRLRARATDCSLGGIGLSSAVFLPIGCPLDLEIGGVTVRVEVRRATMTDRTPTYYLGTSFAESCDEPSRAAVVQSLITPAAPGTGDGGRVAC